MELKDLLRSLEERLVQHDNSRKEIQDQLQEICLRFIEEADLLEEKINKEIQEPLNEKEERVLNLIEKLNNREEENESLGSLMQQVREELSHWQQYEIKTGKPGKKDFVSRYNLKITEVKNEDSFFESENDTGNIVTKLQENLDKTHYSVASAQDQLAQITTGRRNQGNELKERINEELGRSFSQEDARIQETVIFIKAKINEKNIDEEELIKKIKLTLLINQKYSIFINRNRYDLIITKGASLKQIKFEERKPSNVISSFTDKGEFSFSFLFFSDEEINVLKHATDLNFNVTIKIWDKSKNDEENSEIITKEYILGEQQICFSESFYPSTTYCMIMRIEYQGLISGWSDNIEFTTPEFKACVWKECPDNVSQNKRYILGSNSMVATTTGDSQERGCTIIGNMPLPKNKITLWTIKLKCSKRNGGWTQIGVAPSDINQNSDNFNIGGWFLDLGGFNLRSGPPHNYPNNKYGPRKGECEYVHTGDSIGVVMDTTKGELSFVLEGVNLGVAYEGIPLDKPLVPCVILSFKGESVELII